MTCGAKPFQDSSEESKVAEFENMSSIRNNFPGLVAM